MPVSLSVQSKNGVGFVAERPMFFVHDFGNGVINGSDTVLGAEAADTAWFFAEGTTRAGFFEFVTIQNPNTDVTLNGIAFDDFLPSGLRVSFASPPGTTCSGTTSVGPTEAHLSGATLAPNGTCTVTVPVIGTTAGVKNNSVQVTSTEGGTGNTSNASVTGG